MDCLVREAAGWRAGAGRETRRGAACVPYEHACRGVRDACSASSHPRAGQRRRRVGWPASAPLPWGCEGGLRFAVGWRARVGVPAGDDAAARSRRMRPRARRKRASDSALGLGPLQRPLRRARRCGPLAGVVRLAARVAAVQHRRQHQMLREERLPRGTRHRLAQRGSGGSTQPHPQQGRQRAATSSST
eukprot:scaffold4253_cov269-Prasinococcus_capsulatus_cf.AAC.2